MTDVISSPVVEDIELALQNRSINDSNNNTKSLLKFQVPGPRFHFVYLPSCD